jgi:dolichol kinase
MKKISSFEIRRQIFHAALGIALIFLIELGILNALRIFLILIAGGIVSIISRKFNIPIIFWFLRKFERPEQIKKFPGKGAISYFIGVLLVVKLFSPEIALASIAILALGDPLSHFVGQTLGKIKSPVSSRKMLEGNLVGALVASFAASFFVTYIYAFTAAFFALFLESIEIKMNDAIIDDNIVIPLAAGTAIMLMTGL